VEKGLLPGSNPAVISKPLAGCVSGADEAVKQYSPGDQKPEECEGLWRRTLGSHIFSGLCGGAPEKARRAKQTGAYLGNTRAGGENLV